MQHRYVLPVHSQPSPPPTDEKVEYAAVLRALQGWRKGDDAPLVPLLLYEQARQQLGPHAAQGAPAAHVLEEGLRRLAAADAEAAHLLRQRFQEDVPRQQLANTRHCSLSHLDRLQREAVLKLAATIDEAEREAQAIARRARAGRFADLHLRLDLAAGRDRLFGVDPYRAALVEWLERPGPPHLFLVEGMGGIGKTALTAAVLRRILDDDTFDQVAWVTAQQQRFLPTGETRPVYNAVTDVASVIAQLAEQVLPVEEQPLPFSVEAALSRLQARLQRQRALLVVDNLETLEELDALLPRLSGLADPAKLLFTSRVYPRSDALLHRLVLPELERGYAGQLVRHLAELAGIDALTVASEPLLDEVYATVGGNPLALRLLVGQCRRHSPEAVLQALRQMQGRAEEHLYIFIFRHVWDALDEPDREVLLAFTTIPPTGADQSYIVASSGLDGRMVHDGLARLVDLNLVEHQLNSTGQSRYAIHSLTRTFLLTEVLRSGEW